MQEPWRAQRQAGVAGRVRLDLRRRRAQADQGPARPRDPRLSLRGALRPPHAYRRAAVRRADGGGLARRRQPPVVQGLRRARGPRDLARDISVHDRDPRRRPAAGDRGRARGPAIRHPRRRHRRPLGALLRRPAAAPAERRDPGHAVRLRQPPAALQRGGLGGASRPRRPRRARAHLRGGRGPARPAHSSDGASARDRGRCGRGDHRPYARGASRVRQRLGGVDARLRAGRARRPRPARGRSRGRIGLRRRLPRSRERSAAPRLFPRRERSSPVPTASASRSRSPPSR